MTLDGMTEAERYLVAAGTILLIWGAGVALVNLALWIYNGGHHGN